MPDDKELTEEEKAVAGTGESDQVGTDGKPIAAEGAKSEGEEKSDDGAKGEDGGDDAAELTPEQIAELTKNPALREAILGDTGAQDSLDKVVAEALAESQRVQAQDKATSEQKATVDEALKKASEDGDYSELGRLAADSIARSREVDRIRPGVVQDVYAEYDAAVSAVYGDEIAKLSEEDRKALNRSGFASDGDFLEAVFTTLRDKHAESVRSESTEQLTEAQKAAENATVGAKARGDGTASLPGGSAEQGALSENLGDLIRQGLTEGLDIEE